MVDPGVGLVRRAEDDSRLFPPVGPPRLGDPQCGDHGPFGIAQRQSVGTGRPGENVPGHVQGHGHRPERAIREPHLLADRQVVLLAQEGL
jgi:hypothetical protein